jgi:bifunctional non-homologous end joining protein LigD
MRLGRRSEPFDHPDWIFEIKYDGFRALAYIENGVCRLISRNNHAFKGFGPLCASIAESVRCKNAVIDGELVCLSADGKPRFYSLMFRRQDPHFCAFDILWLNGRDLRALPLLERKRRLRRIIQPEPSWIRYVDHAEDCGVRLFQMICARDLEGIVAKLKTAPYADTKSARWIKVKNPAYSQAEGRRELFDARR